VTPPLPAVQEQHVLFIMLLNEEPAPACPHSVSFIEEATNQPPLLQICRFAQALFDMTLLRWLAYFSPHCLCKLSMQVEKQRVIVEG